MPTDVLPAVFDVAKSVYPWIQAHAPHLLVGGGAAGVAYVFLKPSEPSIKKRFLRGAAILAPSEYKRRVRRDLSDFAFAGVPLTREAEAVHGLVSASTGAGKSVALVDGLQKIRARGDRAIVIDVGSGFTRSLARPTDLVVDVFAPDFGWRLANEVFEPKEFRDIAKSVLGEGSSPIDEQWRSAAQALLSRVAIGLLEDARAAGETLANQAIMKAVVGLAPSELEPFLSGSSVESLSSEKEQKILQSVRFSYIKPLEVLCDIQDGEFSFSNWMRNGPKAQWMFLKIPHGAGESYRRVAAMLIDIMIYAAMKEDESGNIATLPAKTWIVIDEMDSLGEIPALVKAVTQLRKFNVSVLAAIQDFAQLETRYGRTRAETILNNFPWKLVLRTSSHELSARLAKMIGSARYEITRKNQSWSKTREDHGSIGGSMSVEERDEQLVMAEEIQGLPTGQGYLLLPAMTERVRITVQKPKEN